MGLQSNFIMYWHHCIVMSGFLSSHSFLFQPADVVQAFLLYPSHCCDFVVFVWGSDLRKPCIAISWLSNESLPVWATRVHLSLSHDDRRLSCFLGAKLRLLPHSLFSNRKKNMENQQKYSENRIFFTSIPSFYVTWKKVFMLQRLRNFQ